MKKLNIETFDPKRYAEYLDEQEMKAIAARKMEQTFWQKRRRSLVFREICKMACKKQKVSRRYLGQTMLALSNSRTRAIQRVSNGEIPRFEKWMFACKLAGISRADAVVLWARESIPDHFSEFKKYVGVTLKHRRKMKDMDWQANPSAEDLETARDALDFLRAEGLEYGAKPLPDLPGQIPNLGR